MNEESAVAVHHPVAGWYPHPSRAGWEMYSGGIGWEMGMQRERPQPIAADAPLLGSAAQPVVVNNITGHKKVNHVLHFIMTCLTFVSGCRSGSSSLSRRTYLDRAGPIRASLRAASTDTLASVDDVSLVNALSADRLPVWDRESFGALVTSHVTPWRSRS